MSKVLEDMRNEAFQEGIQIGREKGIQIGRQIGIPIGRQMGIQIGRQMGIQIGKRKGLIAVAKRILASGTLSLDEIANLLELSPDEMKRLQAE